MTKEDAFAQALAGAIAPMMGFTELDEATVLNHVETGLRAVVHALEKVVAIRISGAMAKENQILYSVELT
jgi:hypothetical protein